MAGVVALSVPLIADCGKGVLITVPRLFAMPDLQRAVEEMRPRLLAMMEKDAALHEQKRQRLIMLHELTHIHHMDHSPAFHAELNALLGGKEQELEQELKAFQRNRMQPSALT